MHPSRRFRSSWKPRTAVAVATDAPQAPTATRTQWQWLDPYGHARTRGNGHDRTESNGHAGILIPTEEPVAATGPIVFEIVQDESEARFIIDEVLRGSPKTVVGVTNQVAGQIAVDPANPASAQVGQISINARTLATDSDMRNRAVKNRILQTDTYEFVTFQPTQLTGLPESAAAGEPLSFQIVGDLTIRDTTKQVTFDVTLTPVDETRLEGLATLTIPYRDFGLAIPDSPSVDTVADDVTLELEFVAVATQ